MDWIGDACRENPPRPGFSNVRMPGDRGLSLKRDQLRDGVALHPTIAPALEACAERYDLRFPAALTE
jgi:LDH2 family malate/lactate/ureidoglycolate dehydrogenase